LTCNLPNHQIGVLAGDKKIKIIIIINKDLFSKSTLDIEKIVLLKFQIDCVESPKVALLVFK